MKKLSLKDLGYVKFEKRNNVVEFKKEMVDGELKIIFDCDGGVVKKFQDSNKSGFDSLSKEELIACYNFTTS